MAKKRFRILSLNGGGVRALFQARYLHILSTEHGVGNFWQDFDLIIGTSAGAMVAAALCAGKTPEEIANFFETTATSIFADSDLFWKGVGIYLQLVKVGKSIDSGPLKIELQKIYGGAVLGDFKKPYLAVTATELEGSDIRVFSPITQKKDEQLKVVDVVMASAALPGAFPDYAIHDPGIGANRHYIDGGLWANAPLLASVALAIGNGHASLGNIRIVSIGTAASLHKLTRKDYKDLKVDSSDFYKHLFNISFTAGENTSHEAVQRLVGAENVLHIDGVTNDNIKAWDASQAIAELPRLASKCAGTARQTASLRSIIK